MFRKYKEGREGEREEQKRKEKLIVAHVTDLMLRVTEATLT